jgi:hypothetical protein
MKSFPSSLSCISIGVFLSAISVDAFTTLFSKPTTTFVSFRTSTSPTLINLNNPSLLLSEAADGVISDSLSATSAKTAGAIMDIGSTLPEAGGGIMDIAKNIAFAITAVLFLGAGLALVTAAIIVPGKSSSHIFD